MFALSGCHSVGYKIPVIQGSPIFKQDVEKIKIGMSRLEVESIIGAPLIINIATNFSTYYFYDKNKNHGYYSKQLIEDKKRQLIYTLTIEFENDLVKRIIVTEGKIDVQLH